MDVAFDPPDANDEQRQPSILIVDDEPATLRELVACLEDHGLETMLARDGRDGLDRARQRQPDLILLDVRMPGMDGYEVCRRLKAVEETRGIPVIFGSAPDEGVDKVKGFEIGGVDHVAKPFYCEEVLARVETHLTFRSLQKRLVAQNAQLEREIAVRRRAEAALRESETRLRAAIDALPFDFWLRDRDGRCVMQNAASIEMWGDVVGSLPEEQAVALDTIALWQSTNARAFAGETVRREVELEYAEGRGVFDSIIAPIQEEDDVLGILGLNIDITERRQAEKALRESEQQYRALFATSQRQAQELALLDQVRTALARELDLQALFGVVVEAIANTFGYTLVALSALQDDVLVLQHQFGYDQAIERIPVDRGICGRVARTGKPVLLPDVRADPDFLGPVDEIISEVCIPLFDRGNVIGVLNVESTGDTVFGEADLRLLTALSEQINIAIRRARLYTELRSAVEAAEAANRAKSTFLANMSHELRTPLNAVLGFAQLMERDPSVLAGHGEHLDMIRRSGEHLLELINDVLELSRIEAGSTVLNTASFDLHRALDEVEEMVRFRVENKGLLLAFERGPDLPRYVRTDERKLRQVLINLLDNASKFTEEGGVTLRVKRMEHKAGSTTDSLLYFEVEDTGVGIAPDEMDQLFEAFAQTGSGQRARQGTGLGLPISRQFVRLMGGEITVRSQLGRGTLLSFDVRVEPAAAADIEIRRAARRAIGLEAGQRAPDGGPYRILIAEDRLESRILLRELLDGMGLAVREAANGQEAVDLATTWRPHLIWMDMRMPVMDGYEATRQIKGADASSADAPSAIIIALTASAFEEDRAAVLAAGCDGFLRKPFRESEVFELMAKHLGLRVQYDEPTAVQVPEGQQAERDALTADALAALPAAWVADLKEAILDVDLDRVSHLIEQIGERDAPLADALRACVDDFEYERILGLIQALEGRSTGVLG